MLTAEAFWVVQDNVDDPPGDTVTGCALNVNVVGWLTVTVTDGENAVPLLYGSNRALWLITCGRRVAVQ